MVGGGTGSGSGGGGGGGSRRVTTRNVGKSVGSGMVVRRSDAEATRRFEVVELGGVVDCSFTLQRSLCLRGSRSRGSNSDGGL